MKEVLPSSAQDVYSYLDDDDYGRDRSDDIVETTERTDQKSHIANYMEIAPAPGRFGEIQCLTEKDGKVLHTWRYKIIRELMKCRDCNINVLFTSGRKNYSQIFRHHQFMCLNGSQSQS